MSEMANLPEVLALLWAKFDEWKLFDPDKFGNDALVVEYEDAYYDFKRLTDNRVMGQYLLEIHGDFEVEKELTLSLDELRALILAQTRLPTEIFLQIDNEYKYWYRRKAGETVFRSA